jgi:hypothetical protein
MLGTGGGVTSSLASAVGTISGKPRSVVISNKDIAAWFIQMRSIEKTRIDEARTVPETPRDAIALQPILETGEVGQEYYAD